MTTSLTNRKKNLIEKFPEIEEFFIFKLEALAEYSQANYITTINKLQTITGKNNPKELTNEDMKNLLNDKDFKLLSNSSKNQYIIGIKVFLTFFKREELANTLPVYSEERKELNKSDLISREDLDLILKNVNTKKKALIMVLYEGALRRSEVVNILFKDIQFESEFVNLFIRKSKTIKRNIPLIESIPYLREYFNQNDFNLEDKIFDYLGTTITVMFSRLNKKLKEKYKKKWSKKLHPHLLRHSRLTELAGTKLNEPQLRKFAGWSKNSKMPAVYFHLDDSDLRNKLVKQAGKEKLKKPKPKTFKPIICEICKEENNQQNAFCYKCGNIIDETRAIVKRFEEKDDIEKLKQELKEIKKTLQEFANEFRNIKKSK